MNKLIVDKSGRNWTVLRSKVNGFVRSGGWVGRTGPMFPATIQMIIKGNIERNAVGGAVIYEDKDGMSAESVHVEYLHDKPIEMSFKGETIAFVSE